MEENVKVQKIEVISFFQKPSFLKGVRQGFLFSSLFLVFFQVVKPTALAFCAKENILDSNFKKNSGDSRPFDLKKQEYLKTWFSIKSWRSYFQGGFKSSSEYHTFSSTIKTNISPFLTGGLLGIILGTSIGCIYDKLYLSNLNKTNLLK
jgi:hypothetical protein